jgi:hypothetical protein
MTTNGNHPPVDGDRQRWLKRVVAACNRVLAGEAPDERDPYLRTLVADVETLRTRLQLEFVEGSEASGLQ